ncbi:CaiB/BaiF CoA transferase family protein [Paraburkholderia nemoris]|uniref:Acetyl-CoA:oxalate CoA-transferase n=1 Tax=Paraburkholderia nemoris TaxID=2793076 RepID=A0ABM8QYY3_9BURK|nr:MULTISPECIES: CaiB/BaiF CoA-transferase family protein [Paraburkholderia]MBK3810110.1 CoA transferase [Paraburkholderia aspalathi]CAE6724042.1 Acetyl-CoA:oxalate CoA-transferase [Paraburkholderia nemoris]CAE6749078.1 Acetyl-CoA:oxalate CoA-transferase [Paraburkholderia nemoris]
MTEAPGDLHNDSTAARGALYGLKVLDLSRVLAGPLAAQMLADHGADVTKIEPPQGDETRELGPPFVRESAAYFEGLNRNKRAMSLDLAHPEGRKVLLKLLVDADVLVENFLPCTMKKWGLDYTDVLQKQFPRLIYCRISGFGNSGPLSSMPGYDAVLQAFCGLMSINGRRESGPTRIGIPIVDTAVGMSSVIGILLAVTERARSGMGQLVDTSLFETALSLLHPHTANWFASGNTPVLSGNAHPNICPYDTFTAARGEVFIGVVNDGQFQRFCNVIERADLVSNPRFNTNRARVENRAALRLEIEPALRDIDATDLCRRLTDAGVSASQINSVADVLRHPHTLAREMVVELAGYKGIGIPVKLSRTPGSVRKVPPAFAADTESVLREAGYDRDATDALIASGVTPKHRRKKT